MTSVSHETVARLHAHNIARTTKLTGWLEPIQEPMRFRDYAGAAVLFAMAGAAFWLLWAVTP